MGKYGEVAVEVAEDARNCSAGPREAWRVAAGHQFPNAPASQDKGCPRDTFLALCGAGLVKGVRPGNYTRSRLNKSYALAAVALLSRHAGALSERDLWDRVAGASGKAHNAQMDVVLSLSRAGLLTPPKA